jgi:hypothetical protein
VPDAPRSRRRRARSIVDHIVEKGSEAACLVTVTRGWRQETRPAITPSAPRH